jgi:ABC-type nitrate/sulfonate/bicarbonate transport system substrate-binding protein
MVGADSAQFGICGQEQLSQARVSGKVPVVAIAAILQHNTSGFASPADRKILTPKDFEGKKYSGWGTPLEEKFISTLMQKSSGDFKKVEMRMMGATDFFASMETEADFAWIYYGWDGIGAKTKNYPLNFILLQDVDPVLDFYSPVIISNEKTLHDNPEMVKKFMKAVARGYKDAVNNPEEACDLLLKHTEGTDRALAIESTRYLAGYFMDENQRFGVMKESIWKNFSQWMLENKLLDSKLDITTSYTNQYLP